MDLGAYAQIEKFDKLAKDNGIDIPRLRGYRLMSEETPISQEEIDQLKIDHMIRVVENLFCDLNPNYYLVKDHNGDFCGIRWDRIHGRKRRVLKFEIKKQKRRVQQQYDIWNKYAGREGVLYIHSRIGGNNLGYFDGPNKIANRPWFLERVDDSFDNTYCDIYAKVDMDSEVKYE